MIAFIRKYWSQILFVCVLFVAWIAFLTTTMPGTDSPLRYFKALYFAFTLFIFGALDIGFPQSESTFVVVVLWTCYFIAPAFTISYAYTIIEERLLNRLPFNLNRHSVILGMGRTGMFLYEIIKRSNSHEKIVIVDRDLQNPHIPLYEQARSVWWIRNDFEDPKVLLKARVPRAKRVFITTNNDLANLQAAFKCLELNPGIERIYCHLQNYVMHEDFTESLRRIPKYHKIVIFNAYTSAAQEVLKLINTSEKSKTAQGRFFIFLGFGHFGHTLFDDLISDQNTSDEDEILIATLKTKLFFDTAKYDWSVHEKERCKIHSPIYDDIFTASLWDKLNTALKGKNKQVIVINCLDDPEANISLAVQIKKKGPETLRKAVFYCRTFKPLSENLEEVLANRITDSDSRDIIPFSLESALNNAYRELLKE